MKIALLFRSYGPYHIARLGALRLRHPVVALEHSAVDPDYDWDAIEQKRDARVVSLSKGEGKSNAGASFMANLANELVRFSADVIAIPGYSEPFALAALRVSHALGIPAVLMSDTHAGSARGNFGREILKRQLLPLYQSALVAGSLHAEYLASLGFPEDKIETGFDVVDNQHFANANIGRGANNTPKRYDLPQSYFFCSARFIAKKNLLGLLEAFALYRREHGEGAWDLVLAGDGPLRDAVTRRAAELSVVSNVYFLGQKSYGDLPGAYARAGAFVLASTVDEWGLVVNEAMAAGLPVLVSKGAGCHRDLVDSGVNGFVFDPMNVGELSRLMGVIATSTRRKEMGDASWRIIANWDLDRFATGLVTAAGIAKRSRSRRRLYISSAVAAALSLRV
ncbi:glycosyltransferase family 4 protein [Hyphomicrobium facile]|uniref:Glycosyltransferase involved in cell wall bisynthesis n=1 Tax=Hyphomicrobium facile TaxID=51670 RepID=A0A1I7NJ35_9HYPH|nr:glycosyltransferase family 4 protein [Hyphomicrobium facile]SFV34586.1 Glycosyltransferase involved in cell wall bisynthesis [Hyphomicrobium facile]